MNLYDKLNFWPFNYWYKQREKAERIKEIEEKFRIQLKEAYSKHGDLDEAVKLLRKSRETKAIQRTP